MDPSGCLDLIGFIEEMPFRLKVSAVVWVEVSEKLQKHWEPNTEAKRRWSSQQSMAHILFEGKALSSLALLALQLRKHTCKLHCTCIYNACPLLLCDYYNNTHPYSDDRGCPASAQNTYTHGEGTALRSDLRFCVLWPEKTAIKFS